MGHLVEKCFKKKRDDDDEKSNTTKAKQVSLATTDSTANIIDAETPIADYTTAITDKTFNTTSDGQNHLKFLFDSGSTCHIVTDASVCHNVRHKNITITVGNKNKIQCHLIGDIVLQLSNGLTLKLKDVRIVPTFGLNIFSWPTAAKAGFKLIECRIGAEIRSEDMKKLIVKAPREGDELCYFTAKILKLIRLKKSTEISLEKTTPQEPQARDQGKIACKSSKKFSNFPSKIFKTFKVSEENSKNDVAPNIPKTVMTRTSDQDQTFRIVRDGIDPSYSRKKTVFTWSELILWHRRMGHRNFRDIGRILFLA